MVEGNSRLDLIHLQDFGDELGPKPTDRLWFGGGNMDQFHTVHNNNEKGKLAESLGMTLRAPWHLRTGNWYQLDSHAQVGETGGNDEN